LTGCPRNAAFLLTLRDSGTRFVAVDLPDANELTVRIFAVVAEDERRRISERTRAALAEAKKRGVKLGNPHGARPLLRAMRRHRQSEPERSWNLPAVAKLKAKADQFALDMASVIADIEATVGPDGRSITSNRGIALELNRREIRNARGGVGSWTDTTVARLRRRLCPASTAA
jgi:hypothetical protein